MLTVSERIATLEDCLRAAVNAGTKNLRCACPGIVQSWNATAQTVTVKLAIKEVLSIEGAETETEIPLLVDVPVVMPRAGGYSLLFVPQAGDECLVVFSDMCIDAWWQSGGIQSQAERRRHDLSDGFAIMGCWSQVKKPSFPTKGMRLQSDDGTSYVAIDENGVHFGNADIGVEDIDSNENGVAIGMDSTATSEDKKFEVAEDHVAYIYGDAQVGNALYVGGNTQVSGDLEVTGDIYQTFREWTNLNSSLSGVTVVDDVEIIKIMDVCYLRGTVYLDSALSLESAGLEIMTLPEAFRPNYNFNVLCAFYDTRVGQYANGSKSVLMIDGTTGKVKIMNRNPSMYSGADYNLSLCTSWAVL